MSYDQDLPPVKPIRSHVSLVVVDIEPPVSFHIPLTLFTVHETTVLVSFSVLSNRVSHFMFF